MDSVEEVLDIGESDQPTPHEKTATNPKGAGRPKGSGKRPAPPRPPAPEKSAAEQDAESYSNLKITPALCKDLATAITGSMAIAYGVAARVFADQRWNLTQEEVGVQTHLCTVALIVYGDRVKEWVVPVVLMTGLSAPLAARLMMPPLAKSNNGAPVPQPAAA
jgi:hypothetical protein